VQKHQNQIIAIDGPAGSGKSTAARLLAPRVDFLHVDTGAIYRTLTLLAIEGNIDLDNQQALAALVPQLNISFKTASDRILVFSGDREVSNEIRNPELTAQVHFAAASPLVRQALQPLQRSFAVSHSVVMEGRDIGTVIFPDADLKFFLDAPLKSRAERRWRELQAKGEKISLQEVEADQTARDKNDTDRQTAPLRAAEDAIVVDTGLYDIDGMVEELERIVRSKLAIPAGAEEQS
jgi:CMP/dCMP kinase